MTLAQLKKQHQVLTQVLYPFQLEKEEWIEFLPLPQTVQRILYKNTFIPKPDDTPKRKDSSSNEEYSSN